MYERVIAHIRFEARSYIGCCWSNKVGWEVILDTPRCLPPYLPSSPAPFPLTSPPLQRLREFWEGEVQKAVAGVSVGTPTAGAVGAGAGTPPSSAERGAAFAAWMAACRLLEVEASELEVRTRVPH